MPNSVVNDLYFKWLIKLALPWTKNYGRYSKLLSLLNSTPFTYILERDANRMIDGLNLRHEFAREIGMDTLQIDEIICTPCSVLEMMVALAERCELEIMYDMDYGDRSGEWFMTMIDNLGLGTQTDEYFDLGLCEAIIQRLLSRTYERNGVGSMFPLPGRTEDMRRIEIWYQMNWYLNELG